MCCKFTFTIEKFSTKLTMKREFHPLLTLKGLQITEIFFPSMRKESVNVSIPMALQTSIGFLISTNLSHTRKVALIPILTIHRKPTTEPPRPGQ